MEKKNMALQDEEQHSHNLHNILDSTLYCQETTFDVQDTEQECDSETSPKNAVKFSPFTPTAQQDLFCYEESEVGALLLKEKEIHPCYRKLLTFDGSLLLARKQAVEWMLKVNTHYGFSVLTGVLAVNYFDRFITSDVYQKDKPWINQLAAVACLSIAAKVEETHVPLLLDFQVEEAKYVFEARTIQRMELLVLTTLGWRMNPVTPISYFDYIRRRFGLKYCFNWEFMRRCERLLLSFITDVRLVSCLPSVVAIASILHVIQDIEHSNSDLSKEHLLCIFNIDEEKVNDAYKLIEELSVNNYHILNYNNKRKLCPVPSSPSGVIDASFSYDSSNDSWALAPSVSSSPEPHFKRSRVHNQHMRLPLPSVLNFCSLDVLGSQY